MPPESDTEPPKLIAMRADHTQHSGTLKIDLASEHIFAYCRSFMQDCLTGIEALYNSNQETINRHQTTMEWQAAQATRLSADNRRWLSAQHWHTLLQLDRLRTFQEKLLAMRARVVPVMVKIEDMEHKVQADVPYTEADAAELLTLLEVPAPWR